MLFIIPVNAISINLFNNDGGVEKTPTQWDGNHGVFEKVDDTVWIGEYYARNTTLKHSGSASYALWNYHGQNENSNCDRYFVIEDSFNISLYNHYSFWYNIPRLNNEMLNGRPAVVLCAINSPGIITPIENLLLTTTTAGWVNVEGTIPSIISSNLENQTLYFGVRYNKTDAPNQWDTSAGLYGVQAFLDDIHFSYVEDTVNADFTANITEGIAPLTVEFTDLSTGSPDDWNWQGSSE